MLVHELVHVSSCGQRFTRVARAAHVTNVYITWCSVKKVCVVITCKVCIDITASCLRSLSQNKIIFLFRFTWLDRYKRAFSTQPETRKLQQVCCRLFFLAVIKPISGCVRIACSGVMISLLRCYSPPQRLLQWFHYEQEL